MNTDHLRVIFTSLLSQTPLLLMCLAGFVLSLRRWWHHPRIAFLTALASAVVFGAIVVMIPLQVILPDILHEDRQPLSPVFTTLGLLRSLFIAGGLGALVCAAFAERPQAVSGPSAPPRIADTQ